MGSALQAGLRVDLWTPMGVQRPRSSPLNVSGVLKGSQLLNRCGKLDTITIIAATVATWLCAVRAVARFAGILDRAERRVLKAELERVREPDEGAGDMTPGDWMVVRSPEMTPRTIPDLPPMDSKANAHDWVVGNRGSTRPHALRGGAERGRS